MTLDLRQPTAMPEVPGLSPGFFRKRVKELGFVIRKKGKKTVVLLQMNFL
jgi:hypothetical protein